MPRKQKTPPRWQRRRVSFLIIVTLVGALLLSGRLLWLQLIKGDEYAVMAAAFRTRVRAIKAERGTIADRNGDLLALSLDAHSVYANPNLVEDKAAAATLLAPLLGTSSEDILAKLTPSRPFVYLAKKVTPETAQNVKALELAGIGLEESGQRFYPNDSLASHVLGFAGSDNQGLYGLELHYETTLAGTDGQIRGEFAGGKQLPGGIEQYAPPANGSHLTLTLDSAIQYAVEKELAAAVQTHGAKRAIAVVIDTMTGGILAMASKPDFNPNQPNLVGPELWRNPAVTDLYEPGSTFKAIILAAALEEGITNQPERFHCPGFINIPGRNIGCTRAHGDQTLTEATENSCNVAFVTLGMRLGAERLYRYIDRFSVGKKTGIDFPGEAAGLLIPLDRLREVDLARVAIGQAVSVTPLQIAALYAAIANDGVYRPPHLVHSITREDGTAVTGFAPAAPERVISATTAQKIKSMLESVVSEGSGANASIEGYTVAGKTGTAQKISNGAYAPGLYVSSFAGFAPVETPRVAAIVIIDEPKGKEHYGGQICAPIFKSVVETALRRLGVFPVQPDGTAAANDSEEDKTAVPSVLYVPAEEAREKIKSAGLQLIVEGAGEIVVEQSPEPETPVRPGTAVTLKLGERNVVQDTDNFVVVPDLQGRTIRASAELLESYGLYLNAAGSGFAAQQQPSAGTLVLPGTAVRAEFE
ncbi:MAG: penicillin-binding transpeptidase domain-containing protein [bacterium]|jgi:stage V sporulation protein D (sporulation-specific penicillin-binding protein)